jgi:hypothetical protein
MTLTELLGFDDFTFVKINKPELADAGNTVKIFHRHRNAP